MIIDRQEQVTEAVLEEMRRTPDPRVKEILSALVRHLHAFARETRLTEREFEQAVGYVAALGQHTTPSHNEVMLICGSLGLSNLICLMNNGNNGTTETAANNLGPFWRADSPRCDNGSSILRSPTPGAALFFEGWVRDRDGHPVAGADVDIWQASTVGLYENQDPTQAEMNMRGKFTTDADGSFSFRSVKPAGYPVPMQGPTGALLRAQHRHNFRPAHLHALIYKPGFKTMASQVYASDDPYLETDCQFGVTRALIGNFIRHDGPAPAGVEDAGIEGQGPWYSLAYTFVLEPGESWLPKPPISKKVTAPVA